MRKTDRDSIHALPLFKNATAGHFDELVNAALLQKFPAHVALINEGDLPDFLHVVVEGAVEMFASDSGRETTLEIIRPIETFILAAVIRDEPYLKSARTISEAKVLMIPAAAVRDVFDRDAAFARAVVNELAIRYRRIVRTLKNQKLRTGAERLANWLLAMDRTGKKTGRIVLPHEKKTLASLLGMTPENLSRNLAELKHHGVETSAREIIIKDASALTQFARPNPLIDG